MNVLAELGLSMVRGALLVSMAFQGDEQKRRTRQTVTALRQPDPFRPRRQAPRMSHAQRSAASRKAAARRRRRSNGRFA